MHSNYDPQEIAKFSPLAAHWWDVNGDLKTLHEINPLRLKFINEKVSLKDKTAIDVGCGGGILSESLALEGAAVTGIDMSREVIEVAQLHLYESGLKIEYLQTTVEDIAAQRYAQYDIVTCMEMLEHVPDPVSIIRACAQLVKPGGHIFFSTLNRTLRAYLFAILGAEYILKMLPKHTHDYAKFIRPSELDKWSRDAGLIPRDIRGISYHPLTAEFALSQDVAVNYLFYATKGFDDDKHTRRAV